MQVIKENIDSIKINNNLSIVASITETNVKSIVDAEFNEGYSCTDYYWINIITYDIKMEIKHSEQF